MKSYKDLEVRFGFALFMCDVSPVIAQTAGLHFIDTDVQADERYAYSISLLTVPQGMDIQPAVVVLDAGKPGISNYYKITLIGSGNRKVFSFPYLVQTEDNDPPSAPKMLAGKVDSTGKVTLAWKSNTEPDIKGYRIFRANAPFEEFISLSKKLAPQTST